jgi:class 3 adenylate cyclase
MSTASIRLVKYVFLDVVAYTRRTIEAQCDVIAVLNKIVKSAIDRYGIGYDSVIYIPTGDGMCIAFIEPLLPYDIHVTIALDILRRIWVYNQRMRDKERRFEVRIGINQSDDNLLEDINGRRNVAGSGINAARRIMDLADGSQILVSRTVYDTLRQRKKYSNAFGNEFTKAIKHDVVLEVYQLVRANIAGLDGNPPSSLVAVPTPETKLTRLSAYYLAHAIKNEEFIVKKARESSYNNNWLKLLLWFLARDSEQASEAKPGDLYVRRIMPDTGSSSMQGQFQWFFDNVPADVAIELSFVVVDNAVPSSAQYMCFDLWSDYLVVNPEGKKKLKADWPEIWDEFGLGERTSSE